jgi:hypothetical protein
VTAAQAVDAAAALERRRVLTLRFALGALAVGVLGWPVGTAVGEGSETREAIGGAFYLAAIVGLVAAPWIVRAWQGFMRRRALAAAVAGRAEVRHVDGEGQTNAAAAALNSDAFRLAAFRESGLVEAFEGAAVDHVLVGRARDVPFAMAELRLLDKKGYRVFGGVLASFRLARPRPGLTLVARDQGLLGNLVASAGGGIGRIALEDPAFEGVFEAYGTDQVQGRVVLTTTMLERLKALDELAHARGFACAFAGEHLMVAFPGMSWRCAAWQVLRPVGSWLDVYAARLAGLLDLPAGIARTLDLEAPAEVAPAAAPSPARGPAVVPVDGAGGEVFSTWVWRLVGEGGMALVYVASGTLFGGLAAWGAWFGLAAGFPAEVWWHLWGMVVAGLGYGAYAVSLGLRELWGLAWRWGAPLRGLRP